MRITRVRTAQPIAANSPPDWRTSLGQIAVAVETDAGITGYGVGGGGAAGRHVVDAVLREVVVGAEVDMSCIADVWSAMNAATVPFGNDGIAMMAISGVDLAIWDAAAKREGLSIAQLLGASSEQLSAAVPTYSTVWDEIDPVTAAGTQPVKLHVHAGRQAGSERLVVARVKRARKILGPDRELMVDAWMEWTVDSTLWIAEQIAACDVRFIEEPLPPGDLQGYEALARECPLPVAAGEHVFTVQGFEQLIDRQLLSVLQPDVCWCGGLTALQWIYELAQEAGIRVIPHRGSEVWALHAIAALDPQPLAESGRPWMTWVEGQPPIYEGFIRLPDAPGFGVTIDERWFAW